MRKLKKQSAETQKSIHEQTIHGKGLHTFRMCEVQVPHLLVIARTVYTSGLCFTFAHLTVLWITVVLPKMCWKWFQTRLVEVAPTHFKSKSICHMSVMVSMFENNEISNELVSECPGQVSVVSGCPQYHKFPLRPQMFQFSGCGVQVDSNIIIKMRHDKTWIYTNKRIRSPGTCVPLGLCKTNSFAKFAQAEC